MQIPNVQFYRISSNSMELIGRGPSESFRHKSIRNKADEIADGRMYTLDIREAIDPMDGGKTYIPIFPYGSIPMDVEHEPQDISVGTFTLVEGEIDYKKLYRAIRNNTRAR